MNNQDFRALVRAMRTAQRGYFATKDPGFLDSAKRLEREVDDALAEPQAGLFDGEPK